MHRRMRANVRLQNGTAIVWVDQLPVPIRVTRVLYGEAVATNLTSLDVIALAPGEDLDTAVATGNKLITTVADMADKKVKAGTLTANALNVRAGSPIVINAVNGADVPLTPVTVVIEYDVLGLDYGAYDAPNDAGGTYA